MVADQCEEGTSCPQLFMSNKSIIVASEMIRHGYKTRKRLRASLQGIMEPITLTASKNFFGVGFQAIEADVKWAKEHQNDGWVLPQPVPHLARTFVKTKYTGEEEDEAFTAKEIEDICGAMRQMLYEAHMVQPGEGSSTVEVHSNNADLNSMTCLQTSCLDPNTMSNYEIMNQEPKYDEAEVFREINRELEQFENKPKPNLNETEPVNLGISEEVQETIGAQIANLPRLYSYPTKVEKVKNEFLMDEEDAEKMAFTTPWGTYCYRVMPFDLKNVGATYMRAMTAIFHDMMHQEIEVYVDDVIIKSTMQDDHVQDLRKFFEHLRKYDLKLNPAKYAFGVPSGKLLGFVVSRSGIELDPTKIKSILNLPPPRTKKEVKLRHYLLAYTTYLITRLDPLKYIFQKPMPTGRLAKWQILLTVFDIVYVTHTAMKDQALADHLVENPVDDEYHPLSTYFPDEEVNSVEVVPEDTNAWKMLFDGAVNAKGVRIGAILILPTDLSKQFKSVEFRYILRFHNELANALATLASMLPYPGNVHIDPLEIQIRERHGYCSVVEIEPDVQPWYHDIKRFLKTKEYPEQTSRDQKRTIRRLTSGFFLSGEVLYKKTPDLNLLRCVDAQEAGRIMNEVHAGVCGPYMNGYVIAKKILRTDYYSMTMEKD
ncbi:uncharacterized protein [Nicotiana sylvestris]|uniref:uncharacterized protein n=1 Tax=Nicotiana sylvestris TaxID=4096 RepID=UPI00388C402D